MNQIESNKLYYGIVSLSKNLYHSIFFKKNGSKMKCFFIDDLLTTRYVYRPIYYIPEEEIIYYKEIKNELHKAIFQLC